jgi:uncharacterized protein
MDEEHAVALLNKYAKNEELFKKVLAHSVAVEQKAAEISKEILDNGFFIDVDFISGASLLHDIGKFNTPKGKELQHGVFGAEILLAEKLPGEALVAARHLNISKEEIDTNNLDLPSEEYVPETIEEKIIAYVNKLFKEDKEITFEEAMKKAKKISEEAATRLQNLHDEIEELRGKA